MSMSTNIVGIRPPDEKWKKMKGIWDSCEEMEIDPPSDVINFFQGEKPNQEGIEISLPTREWSDENSSGLEIDVHDIPKSVTVIRFYNSW